MKKIIFCLFFGTFLCTAKADLPPLYQAKDSVLVEKLLAESYGIDKNTNLMVFFAKKFLGIPYGANTLERSEGERLTVTLDKLDCTTLVETVTALTLTRKHNQTSFANFISWLKKLRYQDGVIKDYTSRNHYFSTWIINAEKQGWVHELQKQDCHITPSPFVSNHKLDIHYMSHNPQHYEALTEHPEFLPNIKKAESKLTGKIKNYIPKSLVGKDKKYLGDIHDGDILATVTQKDGLDVSHLGLAVWGTDGKLHLLNASSLRHKVVLEPQTLYTYMHAQRSQLGIRVIRVL